MSELGGTLDGVGLPAIVRFLGGLKKSGALRLTHHDWCGDVFFANGQVTGARFGSQSGLGALDALVEVLPGADFQFDSQKRDVGEPSIRLKQEALYIHLDDLARRLDAGLRKFPAVDEVPSLLPQDESTQEGEEPLPLDRRTLQTLLCVNGERSVGDIVEQRGTLDALWQLASLAEVGLIELRKGHPQDTGSGVAVEDETEADPPPSMFASELLPEPVHASLGATRSSAQAQEASVPRCPKLGFDDDPANSFSRPTRLHCCFATGTSMPLALDQQRELCLTSKFGSCPRLNSTAVDEDSRIVHLQVGNRPQVTQREAAVRQEPTRRLAAHGASLDDRGLEPTPLRARIERAAAAGGAVAVAEPPAASGFEPLRPARVGTPEREVPVPATVSAPAERRFAGVPIVGLAGGLVILVVIAIIAYLLLPQMNSLFADDSIDTLSLPNSSRVAAGTPVSEITGKTNPTAVPTTGGAAAAAAPPQATPAAAPPQATPAARPTKSTLQAPPVAAPSGTMLLNEHFTNGDDGWPSSSLGPAMVTDGAYRIGTRLAGQFVALGAPVANPPADITVSAGFRKLAGPAGGGYGIILRDQGPGPRDGASQEGRYYVLEIGDKGEIGIWRRDSDHWVDLLSWQHSDVVKQDTGPNELTVEAVGSTLSMTVNGTEVATRTDSTLSGGQIGVFVGGDGNQVLVDHFLVQTP